MSTVAGIVFLGSFYRFGNSGREKNENRTVSTDTVRFRLPELLMIKLFSPVPEVVQIPQGAFSLGGVHGDVEHGLLLGVGLGQGLAGGGGKYPGAGCGDPSQ